MRAIVEGKIKVRNEQGKIIGTLVRFEVDLDERVLRATLSADPGATGDSSSSGSTNVEGLKPSKKNAEVLEVWDFYLEQIPSRMRLDAKRQRYIVAALKVRTLDEVKNAIVGLSRSPWHNGDNPLRKKYLSIYYALHGQRDESDDERIDKAIEWGLVHDPVYTNVSPAKVERWLEALRYATQTKTEVDEGKIALVNLRSAGFKVERVNPAGPPWVRISR